jgi:hypothetical protein
VRALVAYDDLGLRYMLTLTVQGFGLSVDPTSQVQDQDRRGTTGTVHGHGILTWRIHWT